MKNVKLFGKITLSQGLKKGNNYLNPEIEILADDALDDLSKSKLETFLKSWVNTYIKEILGDLLNLNKEDVKNKYIRALMFQLLKIMEFSNGS